MIQATFDIPMPNSCKECPFLVHCDECESWENMCPFILDDKRIGYDYDEPLTPTDHRRPECPLREVKEGGEK